jgi:hypothetical protein
MVFEATYLVAVLTAGQMSLSNAVTAYVFPAHEPPCQ